MKNNKNIAIGILAFIAMALAIWSNLNDAQKWAIEHGQNPLNARCCFYFYSSVPTPNQNRSEEENEIQAQMLQAQEGEMMVNQSLEQAQQFSNQP